MIDHAYSCAALHAGRSMRDRNAALEAFKNGEIRFLICTDVAARGIDIKELPYVISTRSPLPFPCIETLHTLTPAFRHDTP